MRKLLSIAVCVALLNVGGVRGNDWGSGTTNSPDWGSVEETNDWGSSKPSMLAQDFTSKPANGSLPFDLYSVIFESGQLSLAKPGRSMVVIGFHHRGARGSGVELLLYHRGNKNALVEVICNSTTLKETFTPVSSASDWGGSSQFSEHRIHLPARVLKSSGNLVAIRLSSRARSYYELRFIEVHAKSGSLSAYNPPTIDTPYIKALREADALLSNVDAMVVRRSFSQAINYCQQALALYGAIIDNAYDGQLLDKARSRRLAVTPSLMLIRKLERAARGLRKGTRAGYQLALNLANEVLASRAAAKELRRSAESIRAEARQGLSQGSNDWGTGSNTSNDWGTGSNSDNDDWGGSDWN